MERLTRRAEIDNCPGIWVQEGFANEGLQTWFNGYDEGYSAINKCAEYEDAEEQGLLKKLPCKEVYESDGDTVYYIFEDEIAECVSCGVSIDCDGKLLLTLVCEEKIFPYRLPDAEHDTEPTEWCDNVKKISVDEWNKTVFLVKEEAEQALKKMESEG